VHGNDFDSSSTVWMGDQQLHVNSSTSSGLTFLLPELKGGMSELMLWIQNGNGDLSFSTLECAAPSIESIESDACDNEDNFGLKDCPTMSQSSKLTISGSNFGASGASVLLGGVSLDTEHDSSSPHSKLICSFPTSTDYVLQPDTTVPLSIHTEGGAMSSEPASLSFASCPNKELFIDGECKPVPAEMCTDELTQQDADGETSVDDDCNAAGLLYPTIPVVVILAGQQLL